MESVAMRSNRSKLSRFALIISTPTDWGGGKVAASKFSACLSTTFGLKSDALAL